MQICYLWVERFRNFRDFSFNFDSHRKFTYDKATHRITRAQVEALPRNFFPNPITEVTALVGQNGTGKSNALELTCKILKANKSSFKFDFLLIFADEAGTHCSYKFRDRGHPSSSIKLNYREHIGLDALKVIFYSNVFTDRERDFSGVIDLSPDRGARPRHRNDDNRNTEFQKQIWFINSDFGFNELGIREPTSVSISIPRGLRDPGAGRTSHPAFLLAKTASRLRDRARGLATPRKFVLLFSLAYFSKLLLASHRFSFSSNEQRTTIFSDAEAFINSLDEVPTRELADAILSYLEAVALRLQHVPENSDVKGAGYVGPPRESFLNQLMFIRTFGKRISLSSLQESDSEFRFASSYNFDLAYNLESSGWLAEMLHRFEDVPCFSVNWIGISSGQRAYLNLFSLIAYELEKSANSSIFLCIDEGDLYLHPIWQLEFFSRLLTVLGKTSAQKIQLLLTSHSPFLLSDLPRQNIVVLTDDAEVPIIKNQLEKETFGGNLYDLYAGPLFIDTLKTSLFAQKKIEELAIEARKRPLSEHNRKKIDRRLRLIGDEIIKHIIQTDLND